MLIESTYRSPWYLPGADLQTVVPHLRSIRDVTYKRQRVELDDGDFVDVDWSAEGSACQFDSGDGATTCQAPVR